MSYAIDPRRSYLTKHLFTALRTLPWYALTPALLFVMVSAFFTVEYQVFDRFADPPAWQELPKTALMGVFFGFFFWMIRQFFRIIQLARHYCR